MPVMQVRIMQMPVNERCVPMHVRMRFAGKIAGRMLVLVMGIVNVAMLVDEFLVRVLVLVTLG